MSEMNDVSHEKNAIKNEKYLLTSSSRSNNSISDFNVVQTPYIKYLIIVASICLVISMMIPCVFYFFNNDSILTFMFEDSVKYISFQPHLISVLILVILQIGILFFIIPK